MIYYSSRTRVALAERRSALTLGAAHYSYAHVRDRFVDVLALNGAAPLELLMPEIYATADDAPGGRHRQEGATASRHVHICFKPFDEIRLLKDAVNICVVYWEFSKLPRFRELAADDPRRLNIFNDYTHILSKADEVWVACSFTQQALQAAGMSNVQVVPAPIVVPTERMPNVPDAGFRHDAAEPQLLKVISDSASIERFLRSGQGASRSLASRVRQTREEGGCVFITMFNPHDRRKNAPALLAGFQKHLQRTGRNDLLIVKLVTDGAVATLQSNLQHILPARFREAGSAMSIVDSKNIIYTTGWLKDEELRWLYQLGDFYLCTSSAEGQNLPMMDAMALGLIPISTDSTAMSDYISSDTAFVMPTSARPIPSVYGLHDVTWAETTPADVAGTLDIATRAPLAKRAEMRRAGLAVIADRYGQAAIWQKLEARLLAWSSTPPAPYQAGMSRFQGTQPLSNAVA